jgi:hypothetical protein
MARLSNLPPGVTDAMIERQANHRSHVYVGKSEPNNELVVRATQYAGCNELNAV